MHKRKKTGRKKITSILIGVVALVAATVGLASAAPEDPNREEFNTYYWHYLCKEGAAWQRAEAFFVGGGGNCADGELPMALPGAKKVVQIAKEYAGQDGQDGADGQDGVADIEADGPYPGATQLGDLDGQGENSADKWINDGSRQTSWVTCPAGKVALGGGFHLAADAGDEKAKQVQVVVSEPTGDVIDGDEAQSIRPTGWQVQGFYTGEGEVIVRPWVTCAATPPVFEPKN